MPSAADQRTASQSGKTALVAILGVFIVAAVAALAVMSGKVPGLSSIPSAETPVVAAAPLTDNQAAQTQPAAGSDQPVNDQAAADAPAPAVEAAAEAAKAAATAPSEESPIRPGNPTVAKVGDAEIKRLEVLSLLQQLPPNIKQAPIQQIYPMLLDQAINSKIIDARAAKTDLAQDAQVKEQVELARQQIIRNIFLQKEAEKAVTEEKVKAAYDTFIKEQGDIEETKARHILVDTEDKAKDIIAKLDSGAKFEDLAKEYSSDGTKDNGGDLGWFAKQEMVPAFADAAFALKPGEASKTPVKTQFGYHVVKVEDRRMREKPKFDDIKPFLEAQLRREALEKMIGEWRKDQKIEQFDINGDPLAPAAGAESPDVVAPDAAPAPVQEEPKP